MFIKDSNGNEIAQNPQSIKFGSDYTVTESEGEATINPTNNGFPAVSDGGSIDDTNSNEVLEFGVTASAVNEVKITNAATGGSPLVEAQGGDTNIDLRLTGKGTGGVLLKTATEIVAATNVITAAESGKTFFLNDATEFVSTLPAAAQGLEYTFIVTGAPSGASYTIVTDSSANVIQGTVIVNGASVAGANEDTITFADGAAVVGDWVRVISDGTNWYVCGVGQAASSITLTQAS